MPMSFKLFGSEIIVNSTPDSTILDPDKELAILTVDTEAGFRNPNPSSSGGSLMAMEVEDQQEEISDDVVSTELGLGNIPEQWTVRKRLTESDLGGLSRLMLPRKAMEECVLSLLGEEMRRSVGKMSGLKVEMVDDDTGRVHKNMVFKHWHSSNSYVINGSWVKYAKSRQLRVNDEIGLRWDTRHCRFHICVLRRA